MVRSAVWFKIDESGKSADGKWAATHKLYETNHIYTVRIPPKLKAGQYLVRHEMYVISPIAFEWFSNPLRSPLVLHCTQVCRIIQPNRRLRLIMPSIEFQHSVILVPNSTLAASKSRLRGRGPHFRPQAWFPSPVLTPQPLLVREILVSP